MSSYLSLLKKLYSVNKFHPPKVGLETMDKMYKLIGRPLEHIPVIHVAGTNGKGSVSTKIARCLQASGLKTGLFTSPHIHTFRERIQVNGHYISVDETEAMLNNSFDLSLKNNLKPTFFEYATTTAMMKFVASNCDVIVLETGIGGRLDATNVITRPALSIITAIQHDHCHVLGNTINEIAKEKCGIIKKDSVYGTLIGPGCPVDTIREEADRIAGASHRIYTIHDELLLDPEVRLTHLPTIPGGNDVEMNPFEFIPQDVDTLNTDIARCAINVLSGDSYYYRRNHDVIDESVILTRRYQMLNDSLSSLSQDTISNMLQAKPQGRFQQYKMNLTDGKDVDIILDIAHNPEAFAALGQKLKYKHGNRKRFRFVLGMTVEKDVASCIHALLDTHVLDSSDNSISCVSAQHPKAMKTQQLHEIVVSALESTTTSDTSHVALLEHGSSNINVESALSNLLATSGENDVIVVCGTAYMISDAISTLKQHNCVEISPTMEVDVDQELQAQEKTWYDAL